ncbi:alpha/beta fold hydrolase [Streptomyces sp. NPDC093225]|uniref:alpha/beta fold hydrolase n=1 Tax=Streptomyces sp. NPDC093225 TaxID=3366034 RepID=UPI003802E8BB
MRVRTRIAVAGVPVHVRVDGTGPVAVLSAGLALGWYDWDPVVPLLAPHRTVVRFDRPGHGLSGPAVTPPTAAGEADRIAALLDALGGYGLPPGPVTVVGHSIAGFHAEAFARRHPDRTAALVLVDGSVEERPPAALPALRTAAARALGAAVTAVGLPAALGPLIRRTAVRPVDAGGGSPGSERGASPVSGRGGPPLLRPDGYDPSGPAGPGGPDAPDSAHGGATAYGTDEALVRAVHRTGRVWRGALLENARYPAMAAEILRMRTERPLPPGLPVTVLAAYDGSARGPALRWLARQAALADSLGARFEVAEPAGHLIMKDRPHQVARAVLTAYDAP